MLSYYQILQVKENASDAEIKQSYRRLVKILHPDKNGNTNEATVIFRLLNQAYETLSDPLERKAYDRKPELSNDDIPRLESYKIQNAKQSQRLKEYEDELKEYKQSVYIKRERERKLVNEISDLKKHNREIQKSLDEIVNDKKKSTVQVSPSDAKTKTKWVKIILLIIGVNLAMFLTYYAVSKMLLPLFE